MGTPTERPRVLVVDDDRLLLRSLVRLLRREFDVVALDSGADAVRWLAAGGGVAAILCDVNMPEVDGWAVYSSLPEGDPRRERFLFMSGAVPSALAQRIRESDVPLLRKPYSSRELLAIVRALAAGR